MISQTRFNSRSLRAIGFSCSLLFSAQAVYAITPEFSDDKITTAQQQLTQVLQNQKQTMQVMLYFDSDSAQVLPQYQRMLDALMQTMQTATPYSVAIAIEGHTDNTHTERYNQTLGQRRAQAVRQIVEPHLGPNFMITQFRSWGESQPVASNRSAAGKALNRRVALTIEIPVREHPAFGQSAYLSKDGQQALLHKDNTLALWNTQLECPLVLMVSNEERILASSVSPNGRLALSGGTQGLVSVWDMSTGALLKSLSGHQGPVSAVAFSQKGVQALSGGWDGQILLWDLAKGTQVATMQGHQTAVTTVAMGMHAKQALSGGADGSVIIWNLLDQQPTQIVKAHNSMVTSSAFTSDMRYAITASTDNQLIRWDLASGQRHVFAQSQPAITAPIYAFDISANNQRLLAAYQDGHILQWDLYTGKLLSTIYQPELALISVAYHHHDQMIIATDVQHNFHFWNANTTAYMKQFTTQQWQQSDQAMPHQSWTEPFSQIQFEWVEGGCYDMGCGPWSKSCAQSEHPVHQVCVDGFWMARNELTQQQWQHLMGFNPAKQPLDLDASVNQVSWNDAQRFVCQLNQQTGKIFRLPTEAEWEYACRNGGQSVSHYSQTALQNMNSGVWEWTLDVFDNAGYQQHGLNNPLYSGDNAYHFLGGNIFRTSRGGAWKRGVDVVQCGRRQYDAPDFRSFYMGFRLIMPQPVMTDE